MSGMIKLDEARDKMLAHLAALDHEVVTLDQSAGRVLTAPIIARRAQPAGPLSAMDGYAVRSQDLQGSPEFGNAGVRLRVVGESAAGRAFGADLRTGEAVRVSTGAAIPHGANQVVTQEHTEREGEWIQTSNAPQPGRHIRPEGLNVMAGQTLWPVGQRLTAEAVALAASDGWSQLRVFRKPRVGVLATGDELIAPGQPYDPNRIYNAVTPGLCALISAWGGAPVELGVARDQRDDVRDKLNSGRSCDLVITIGGASVGDHDHLRAVFAAEGGQLGFEKIAVKPGKPTWFGLLDRTPCLGLPGNPVSALVVARLLVAPAIAALTGASQNTPYRRAVTGVDLAANGDRETYLRAARNADDDTVSPVGNQDSSSLSALASADVLIRREIDAPAIRAGSAVEMIPL